MYLLIITGDNSGILQPQPGNFYGENMSVKITLSGVYSDPETGPLACVTLNFTTMNNSCQNQRQSEVSTTTNENAFYKISLVPNIYSVCEVDQRWQRKELGLIHIFADSQPGTLNEYLVASQPDEAQTCVLQAMQEILSETREVANNAAQLTKDAEAAAAKAQQAAAGASAAAQAETEKLTEKLVTDGSEIAGHGATTIANVLDSHGATTSSRGIGFGPDDETDLTTDHSSALQAMLNTYKYVVLDTIVNCAATVMTGGAGQEISATGMGELRPVGNAMKNKALLALAHPRCIVDGMLITNPLLLKAQTGGRQCAIEIRADDCHVNNSTLINQQSGVLATSVYAPARTKITFNRFIDVIGAGDGEGALTSSYGEDRGDAVTIWGSSTVIMGNHATCKAGEDARIAFQAEYPVSKPANVRDIDGCHTLMIGNYARGPFRRHFVMEGITNGLMTGNISAGGATWWAVAVIQCTNVETSNQIFWDNPGSTAGAKWNPIRAAIGAVNFNTNVTINDRVTFAKGAQGYGFAIATQTGEHIIDLKASLFCAGNKYATYLLRPKLLRMRGVKIDGTENGHRFIGATGQTGFIPTVYDIDGAVNTSSQCVTMDTGINGRWIARGCTYQSAGDTALSLFNMDSVILQGCMLDATKYAVSLNKTRSIKITGCISNSDAALAVRINSDTTGNIGLSDWFFDGNALTVDFVYTDESLSNINSPLNVKHKWPGRVVSTGAAQYVAAGGQPGSGWVPLVGGEKIMPVQQEIIEQ
ncbi:prophage tail fiber N-terminal domain-containing protein [Mixta calida]|uniref:Lambda-like tail fibre protein N-terminal domain-containing protein n=2 Tax=Mixta calida TaxID=665913 RepID=A0ABN5H8U6_9GAMM|nr:prophage tail fiber N-terminal domain-containing protein [Mixta calida]AUY24956.1 hypothetical protein C2E16_08560 [Mixta calida]